MGTPNAGRRQAYYYDYYSHEGLSDPVGPAKSFVIDESADDEEPVEDEPSETPSPADDAKQPADEVGSTP